MIIWETNSIILIYENYIIKKNREFKALLGVVQKPSQGKVKIEQKPVTQNGKAGLRCSKQWPGRGSWLSM